VPNRTPLPPSVLSKHFMAVELTIENTFGVLLLGYVCSTFISGIFYAQVLWYYRAYPEDRLQFKTLVGVLCALEFITTVLCFDMIWDYLVVRGSIDATFLLRANGSLIWMVLVTGFCGLVVDTFYILRIWTLTNKSKYVTLAFIPPAIYTASSIVAVVSATQDPLFLHHAKVEYYLAAGESFRTLSDVCIAGTMCTLMYRRRSQTSRSNFLVKLIFIWSLTSGALTSLFIFVALVMYIKMPANMIYIAVYLIYARIGGNGMLASLNMRKVLRRRSNGEIHLQPLPAGPSTCRNTQRLEGCALAKSHNDNAFVV